MDQRFVSSSKCVYGVIKGERARLGMVGARDAPKLSIARQRDL